MRRCEEAVERLRRGFVMIVNNLVHPEKR